MNVNAQYKLGIDRNTLQQVSQEIMKRAAEKNSQYSQSTSNVSHIMRSADIGLDLYQGRIDTNTARQIAMNNSGLQIQLNQKALDALKYLNCQAAQNIQKNVDGKITVAMSEGVGNTQKSESKTVSDGIVSLATGKDKNGSAPSYKGEFLFIKKEKDTEEAA